MARTGQTRSDRPFFFIALQKKVGLAPDSPRTGLGLAPDWRRTGPGLACPGLASTAPARSALCWFYSFCQGDAAVGSFASCGGAAAAVAQAAVLVQALSDDKAGWADAAKAGPLEGNTVR